MICTLEVRKIYSLFPSNRDLLMETFMQSFSLKIFHHKLCNFANPKFSNVFSPPARAERPRIT